MPQTLLHLQDIGPFTPLGPGHVLFLGAMQHSQVLLAACDLPGTSSQERWSEDPETLLLYQWLFIHKICHIKVRCFRFGGCWDQWSHSCGTLGLLAVLQHIPSPGSERVRGGGE